MAGGVQDEISQAMRKIADIWLQLGLPTRRRNERIDEIVGLIRETLHEFVNTEQESLDRMLEYKQIRHAEINEMLSALHLPPYDMPDGLTLFALGRVLHAKFEELKKVKDERAVKLQELTTKRDDTYKRLGEKPPTLKMKTSIPSEEELADLQSICSKAALELKKRKEKFTTIRQAIDDNVAELEYEPANSFEREMLLGDENTATLSQSNINKLIDLHKTLESMNERNAVAKKNMFDRLCYLWDRLDVELDVRDEILAKYPLNSQKTLDAIKADQLDKYEAIRKERIGEFIANIIPETREWWAKCRVADDEQERLLLHFSEYAPESEELLGAWEKELKRQKDFFAENEKVLNDVEALYEAWDELEQIELSEKDPERYKNRKIPSTQIMKEQQRKRKLENQIKKSEKELFALSNKLVSEGNPIMIEGFVLRDFVAARRADYEEAKENEKMNKKAEKQRQIEKEMKFGPSKAPTGGTVLRKTPIKRSGTYTNVSKLGSAGQKKTPIKRAGTYTNIASPVSPSKARRLNPTQHVTKRAIATPSTGDLKKLAGAKGIPSSLSLSKLLSAQGTPKSGLSNFPATSQQSILSVNEDEFQVRVRALHHASPL